MAKVFPHDPKKPVALGQRTINPRKGLLTGLAPMLPKISPLAARKKPVKRTVAIGRKDVTLYFVLDRIPTRVDKDFIELNSFVRKKCGGSLPPVRGEIFLTKGVLWPNGRALHVFEIVLRQSIVEGGIGPERFKNLDDVVTSVVQWISDKLRCEVQEIRTTSPKMVRLKPP